MDQLVLSEPLSLYIIFISFFFLMISLFTVKLRRPAFPPGPTGYPIIGHMHMMDQLTHRGLAQVGKLYGGVTYLRLGVLHMVAVTSPDMAREVLQVQDHVFSNRPATVAVQYLTYDRSDMAFANYGPFWRQMRKLCVTRLFSRKRTESWTSVRDEVGSLIRAIHSNAGQPVNIGELVFNMTQNIIFRAAFGSDLLEGQGEFISILQEFSKLMGAFNIVDFLPVWLRWIDPQGFNKRLKRARDALDRFIDRIIDKHMATTKEEKHETDMVDELVKFFDEEKGLGRSDEFQGAIKIKRDNIKAIIMVINSFHILCILKKGLNVAHIVFLIHIIFVDVI